MNKKPYNFKLNWKKHVDHYYGQGYKLETMVQYIAKTPKNKYIAFIHKNRDKSKSTKAHWQILSSDAYFRIIKEGYTNTVNEAKKKVKDDLCKLLKLRIIKRQ